MAQASVRARRFDLYLFRRPASPARPFETGREPDPALPLLLDVLALQGVKVSLAGCLRGIPEDEVRAACLSHADGPAYVLRSVNARKHLRGFRDGYLKLAQAQRQITDAMLALNGLRVPQLYRHPTFWRRMRALLPQLKQRRDALVALRDLLDAEFANVFSALAVAKGAARRRRSRA